MTSYGTFLGFSAHLQGARSVLLFLLGTDQPESLLKLAQLSHEVQVGRDDGALRLDELVRAIVGYFFMR
jgi:hypothetical protein